MDKNGFDINKLYNFREGMPAVFAATKKRRGPKSRALADKSLGK
jgi:hypothetical protein